MTDTRNIQFGLSANPEVANWSEIANLPEAIELLALDGAVLAASSENAQQPLKNSGFDSIDFVNLLPAPLTRQVTGESTAIINEYKKQLRLYMAMAADFHAKSFSLDPDWEMLTSDESRRQVFSGILSATAGDREYYNLDLNITLRIPGSGTVALEQSLKLLHQMSNYRVNLALDINPHELLSANWDWAAVLKEFRFDTAWVRFCFESDLGNRLLYTHVGDILRTLAAWKRPLKVWFAPSGNFNAGDLLEIVQTFNQLGSKP